MTKNQEDYLSMSQTTLSFLQENTAVWQGNAPLADVVAAIETENDSIIDRQAEQEKSHTGVTDSKQTDRDAVEKDTHSVANALSFCALGTKNVSLLGQVEEGTTDLSRHSGVKLIGIAKVVLEAGTDNLAAAKPYLLTQQMLDDLSKAIDKFTKNLNAPRSAIITVATATDMLAEGINSLHTSYAIVDKGITLYNSNVSFYNEYKKARTIVHSATRHLAMTANFTDTAGNPLQRVKITIVNGTEKLLRKSSPLGNIRVQNLLDGEHTMTVEKPGFATQVITFIVSSPETVMVSVVMK